MKKFFQKLNFVKTCRNEELSLSECPGFLYIVMGILTIIVMIGTYYVAKMYYSEEVVISGVFSVTVIMTCGSFLIIRSVDEIANSRKKTLLFLQSIGDGLLIADNNYKIIDINPVAEGIFDVKKKNILNKDINTLGKVFKECVNSYEKVCISQINLSSDGKKKIYRTVTSKIIDTSGRWTGLVTVLQDITKEKEIDKMKTEFISFTAHELRTPISSIRWNLELLMNDKFQKSTEKEKKVLKDIYNNSSRLNILVRDLLDVSRLEEGKLEIKLEQVDMLKVIGNILRDFSRQIDSKNLEVDLKKKELPKAEADTKRLDQILSNIINNAVKFTPENGKISVDFLVRDNKFLQVSISDTGIGIPKHEQRNVF